MTSCNLMLCRLPVYIIIYYATVMGKKKHLQTIYDNGKALEFVEFLLKMRSNVIDDYAKVFCSKHHLKPCFDDDDEAIKLETIRIAHVSWIDKI